MATYIMILEFRHTITLSTGHINDSISHLLWTRVLQPMALKVISKYTTFVVNAIITNISDYIHHNQFSSTNQFDVFIVDVIQKLNFITFSH